MINGPLLRRTWRAHAARIGLVAVGLGVWSFLMPVIYATFGRQMESLITSGIIPDAFLRLLGGGVFGLDAAIALGVAHPFALALQAVYPVGFAAAAIAGERQHGTLEVLLSRPLSRGSLFLTLLVAILGAAAVTTLAALAGTLAGAAAYGLLGHLDAGELAFLALDWFALFAALGAVSLALSASFDRLGPAIGVALAILLVGYVLELLGTLWPDAEFLQPYSPFHYLRPLDILAGREAPGDIAVLAAVFVVATAYGLWRFPRRDLAAPT